MKINKSKLMKNAWKIAGHGFYKAALRSVIGKQSYADDVFFTESAIENTCRSGLDEMEMVFYLPHVRKAMIIDFTVRDFFAESLKIAWSRAKKAEAKKIEKQLERESKQLKRSKNLANAAKNNQNAPRRELVAAEKYSEGEKIRGFVITGLGETFRPNADMFSLGITPDTDHVQYAYFN